MAVLSRGNSIAGREVEKQTAKGRFLALPLAVFVANMNSPFN